MIVETKKEEQIIYIKDLLFAALYCWKAVVAAAVLLGLLLGGYKAVGALKSQPTVQGTPTKAMQEYQTQKTAMEQRIATLQQIVDNRQSYLKSSLLMQLDPYNHYETRITLFVDTDYQIQPGANYQDPDYTQAVLDAYESVLQDKSVLAKISEIAGVSENYAVELMCFNRESANDADEIMTVAIKCDTAEKAVLLETAVVEILQENSKVIGETVAEHTLVLPQITSAATVDLSLVETQKKEINGIAEMLNSLTDAKTKLAALTPPASGAGASRSAQLKKAVVFGALGVAAGAFLMACVIWVLHIISTKVYSVRTLQNRTGIKVIGCICVKPGKDRIGRWLRKLEGRYSETGMELIATDIGLRLQKGDKVLLTGSANDEKRQALAEALAKNGVQVTEAKDLRNNAHTLEALAATDAVVLVEQCGVSGYDAITRQMEVIADYKKQLLGCVVLDG